MSLVEEDKQIKISYFNKAGCKFEENKPWRITGDKDKFSCIAHAIERKTKQVVGFVIK